MDVRGGIRWQRGGREIAVLGGDGLEEKSSDELLVERENRTQDAECPRWGMEEETPDHIVFTDEGNRPA